MPLGEIYTKNFHQNNKETQILNLGNLFGGEIIKPFKSQPTISPALIAEESLFAGSAAKSLERTAGTEPEDSQPIIAPNSLNL